MDTATDLEFSIEYAGFWDGGSVTGTFSASEANAVDGVVTLDELVRWSWDWSGNDAVGAFSVSSMDGTATALIPPGGFFVDGRSNTAFNADLNDADGLDQGLYESASGDQSIDLGALLIQDLSANTFAEGDASAGSITVTSTANEGTDSSVSLTFIGEDLLDDNAGFDTDDQGRIEFEGVTVGGLSGLTFDAANEQFFAISDDRGSIDPARFFTLGIDLSDGSLDNGDVTISAVVNLTDENGEPFALNELDTEGIALTADGTLFISSERDVDNVPQLFEFSLDGEQLAELPVPDLFIPEIDADGTFTLGTRNNLGFESLTLTPDGSTLFAANEGALVQDGETSTPETGSVVRIVQYNLSGPTPVVVGQFLYETDPIPAVTESAPFDTNGLVELLALDNSGNLLALERSFTAEGGNNGRIFHLKIAGAIDVSNLDGMDGAGIEPIEKIEVFDLADLGLLIDNVESLSFGPVLPNGNQSILIGSDDNFDAFGPQNNQVLAFELAIEGDGSSATDQVITGTPEDDDLIGGNGDDQIFGNGSIELDILEGGAGDDQIFGEGGDDQLFGQDGNDTLFGNGSFFVDILDGGAGNDQLFGGAGDDDIFGGDGNDILFGNGSSLVDILDGGAGDDQLFGEATNEQLLGGDGDDIIFGNGGNDLIVGGNGNDQLFGENSAETIEGGSGDDQIFGNGGGDSIDAGTGLDFVWVGFDGEATLILNEGDGYVTVVGFQAQTTSFSLGSVAGSLTFADVGQNTQILSGDDLLAVVEFASASVVSTALV